MPASRSEDSVLPAGTYPSNDLPEVEIGSVKRLGRLMGSNRKPIFYAAMQAN